MHAGQRAWQFLGQRERLSRHGHDADPIRASIASAIAEAAAVSIFNPHDCDPLKTPETGRRKASVRIALIAAACT
ncbi:MAG: hypothetical protein C5B58_12295 [Acidobacteria bacterium]|nr:MAG: hypothetical protein C5B58_12295 [Acidobacteriota bacterium]